MRRLTDALLITLAFLLWIPLWYWLALALIVAIGWR